MNPTGFVQRIGQIVGDDDLSDGLDFRFRWSDREEGKVLLLRIRSMQKELKLLKQEITAHISSIKSEFMTAKTQVGSGLGAALGSALFGRRTVGKINSAKRDDLRRSQINAVAPYENVKSIIDQVLNHLDQVKGKIELSPEYQTGSPKLRPGKRIEEHPGPRPVEVPVRYFAFIDEEVKGPYSVDQLRALHDTGVLSDETQCCREGSEDWKEYRESK